jgi:GntR family transcriptional regulator
LPQLQQLALAANQFQLSKEIVISTLSNLLDRTSNDA